MVLDKFNGYTNDTIIFSFFNEMKTWFMKSLLLTYVICLFLGNGDIGFDVYYVP